MDDSEQRLVYDLVVTVEHKNNPEEPGVLQRQYIDWLCDNPGKGKHDTYYVQTVLRRLITDGTLRGFKKVHLVSDGGPKHFKNKWAMQIASEWKRDWLKHYPGDKVAPELQWHFYCAYHGHSLCDAHAGRAKTAVRSAQRNAMHDAGALAIGNIPRTAEAVGQAIVDRCAKTKAEILPYIERSVERPELERLMTKKEVIEGDKKIIEKKGIKEYYSFRFVGEPGEVQCRELSGHGEWISTTLTKSKSKIAAEAAAAAAVAALSTPKRRTTMSSKGAAAVAAAAAAAAADDDDDHDYDPKDDD